MKRAMKFLAMLAVLAMVAAACAEEEEPGQPSPTAEEAVSVGLVYDIGGRGDLSFNDSAAAGLDRAASEFNVEPQELEPNQGGTNRAELLDLLASQGTDVIIGVGFLFAETVCAAVKEGGPASVRFVCVVSAPEGIGKMEAEHPDVPIFTAAVDRQLNDRGYILPGLGDFGDRLFGTESGA